MGDILFLLRKGDASFPSLYYSHTMGRGLVACRSVVYKDGPESHSNGILSSMERRRRNAHGELGSVFFCRARTLPPWITATQRLQQLGRSLMLLFFP